MIPKTIHACWLGKAEMPADQKKYVEGWKKIHPDYEIILWTDEMFNKYLDDSLFVKEAISRKKYGFLADYFRFYVLYHFGGIYLDTDVEVLKNFDPLLNCKMFMGFIFDSSIGTAIIGSEKGNPIMLEWIKILEEKKKKKGDFTLSNDWITKYFLENFDDFLLNGKRQSLKCGIELYPKDWFERYQINKKSGGGYSEHHCAGSWSDSSVSFSKKLIKAILPRALVSYLGHKVAVKNSTYAEVYYRHKKMHKNHSVR